MYAELDLEAGAVGFFSRLQNQVLPLPYSSPLAGQKQA
jgi:hypothetical protein